MYNSVPFDPPFTIKITGPEGDRWVEVREDGTEVPCNAPLAWPLSSGEATTVSAAASGNSSKRKNTFLKVPYAEKDEAKRLGAKWDPVRKKWYVPQGVDVAPFSRWAAGD